MEPIGETAQPSTSSPMEPIGEGSDCPISSQIGPVREAIERQTTALYRDGWIPSIDPIRQLVITNGSRSLTNGYRSRGPSARCTRASAPLSPCPHARAGAKDVCDMASSATAQGDNATYGTNPREVAETSGHREWFPFARGVRADVRTRYIRRFELSVGGPYELFFSSITLTITAEQYHFAYIYSHLCTDDENSGRLMKFFHLDGDRFDHFYSLDPPKIKFLTSTRETLEDVLRSYGLFSPELHSFLMYMLRIHPDDRLTAKELLEHPWITV
ncbi:hypothetical protein BDN71DRAFT_1592228 [Pleurotus eryngii]|uniref:Protein kinase domain-containing protein n=1 Tax=Pleurotus eryngii TaxID=5323 RepID=A0A9P6D3U2_PLEER|nr:hypothetical protein BDN71DRAFT_1592228 [Pleurotus eryngii]